MNELGAPLICLWILEYKQKVTGDHVMIRI